VRFIDACCLGSHRCRGCEPRDWPCHHQWLGLRASKAVVLIDSGMSSPAAVATRQKVCRNVLVDSGILSSAAVATRRELCRCVQFGESPMSSLAAVARRNAGTETCGSALLDESKTSPSAAVARRRVDECCWWSRRRRGYEPRDWQCRRQSSASSNFTHVSKQIRQHFPLFFGPEQRPNGSTPGWVQASDSAYLITVKMLLQL
jgi:hypothetical protein